MNCEYFLGASGVFEPAVEFVFGCFKVHCFWEPTNDQGKDISPVQLAKDLSVILDPNLTRKLTGLNIV